MGRISQRLDLIDVGCPVAVWKSQYWIVLVLSCLGYQTCWVTYSSSESSVWVGISIFIVGYSGWYDHPGQDAMLLY